MSAYNIVNSKKMGEGKGAEVKRLFPNRNYPGHHDPFVLLDEFFVKSPAQFPDHEHRGFEAVTYMVEGSFIHQDNLGNNSEVGEGGLQTFNAGKSLIHSEKPGHTGFSHGIQLWVNLPRKLKKSEPTYQKIMQTKIIKNDDNIKIRKLLGEDIPVSLNTDIEYFDIKLEKDSKLNQLIDKKHKGLVYIISGKLKIENLNEEINDGQALLFDKLNKLNIKSLSDSRFIILAGKPLNQKIKIRGSFVD